MWRTPIAMYGSSTFLSGTIPVMPGFINAYLTGPKPIMLHRGLRRSSLWRNVGSDGQAEIIMFVKKKNWPAIMVFFLSKLASKQYKANECAKMVSFGTTLTLNVGSDPLINLKTRATK